MKNLFLAVLALSIAIFSGCSRTNSNLTYTKNVSENKGYRVESYRDVFIDYHAFADEAVHSLFSNQKMPTKIMVTDFVDVTYLDNHTKLGYVLSNNIKNALINNYKANVVEAEVSKYFKISGNGLKILSRDIDKLRATNFNVQYAVVGTYTSSVSELIVFVKLIDLKTGIIKGSYARTFPMGKSTKSMLSTK
jgi:TolB-like protein